MTKSQNDINKYVIHTPLLKYRGSDEHVICSCYWFCLDLAKKYHLHSIIFPFELCLIGGVAIMNAAMGTWLKRNKNYGMMVFVATGNDENSDEKQLFRVNFMDDKNNNNVEKNIADNSNNQNNCHKSATEAKTLYDYSTGSAVKPKEESTQKAREFEKNFSNMNDFYKALKDFGIKWRGENSKSKQIVSMWARNALGRAIDDGLDPFKN